MTKASRKIKAAQRLRGIGPVELTLAGSCTLEAAEGKAARFSIHAYSGGKLPVSGFKFPVVVDLASAKFEDTDQSFVNRHHDQKRELGHADRADTRIDATGIYLDGVFSHENDDTREIITASKRGKKFRASIEALFPPAVLVLQGKSITVNGQTFKGPVYVARNARITGVAILTRAADMDSNVAIAAKHKETKMNEELIAYIEAQGFDPEVVKESEDQVKFFQASMDDELEQEKLKKELEASEAEKAKADPASWSKMVAGQREMQAGEADRVREVTQVCAKYGDPEIELPDGTSVSLCAHAIRTNMSPKEVLLEARLFELDNKGAGLAAPAFHDATKHDDNVQIIECSMSMASGVTEADMERNRWYDEKTINEAQKSRFRGYRVSRLAFQTLQAAGIYHPAGQLDDNYIGACVRAHNKLMASGFTTLSLPGIMSNVAQKTLMAAYTRAASFIPFCFGTTNATDFKLMYSYQLEGSGMLEQLGPTGEIKHGAVVESEYTKKLETYAKMLSFTRNDMINDDMSALTRVANMLGTMAFKAREYAATQTIANSTMFSVPNGNLLTGNPLSIDGLTASGVAFDAMEDTDGLPISVDGDRILAPTSLKVVTSQLINQTEIRDDTTGKVFINNPHAGTFQGFNTQWLDNASASAIAGTPDANRGNTWYRFADPAAAPAFEVVYLNGASGPTIQSADNDFNSLGIQWRCFFDFGFGENDPKMAQRNVGV